MKLKLLIPVLALVGLISKSCYYDNYENLYQNFPEPDCDTSSVTFSATILPILSTNCAISGCHVSPSNQSGLDLSQYSDIHAVAVDGRLMGRITGTSGPLMPPTGNPLPACDIEKINIWIQQGANNN